MEECEWTIFLKHLIGSITVNYFIDWNPNGKTIKFPLY